MRCPLCDRPPVLVLASGEQAFCFNDDCDVVLWDMTATIEENLTQVGQVVEIWHQLESGE